MFSKILMKIHIVYLFYYNGFNIRKTSLIKNDEGDDNDALNKRP